MPRLRILVGPSPATAVPIAANDGAAHEIKGPGFEGRVCVYIRYEDELGPAKTSRPASRASRASNESSSSVDSIEGDAATRYFGSPERKGVTWSVQVQGRFLQRISADDVLFGNTFERPLKLPWGSSLALNFMQVIDPTLEHDLKGQKPWALSPLVSTMPYLAHTKLKGNVAWPAFPPIPPLSDACGSLIPSESIPRSRTPSPPGLFANRSGRLFASRPASRDPSPSPGTASPTSNKRRSIFAAQAARQAITLGPDDILTADFCYGFLSFPSLTLKLPVGISFDCLQYWDRQPVTFVCCRRGNDGKGPGEPFWCVIVEVMDDDEEAFGEPVVTASEEHETSVGAGRVDEVD